MNPTKARKTAVQREREGKALIGVGIVMALLMYLIGAGVLGVILGLAVAAFGGLMWAAGVARD